VKAGDRVLILKGTMRGIRATVLRDETDDYIGWPGVLQRSRLSVRVLLDTGYWGDAIVTYFNRDELEVMS
jgi:hypothetical protein